MISFEASLVYRGCCWLKSMPGFEPTTLMVHHISPNQTYFKLIFTNFCPFLRISIDGKLIYMLVRTWFWSWITKNNYILNSPLGHQHPLVPNMSIMIVVDSSPYWYPEAQCQELGKIVHKLFSWLNQMKMNPNGLIRHQVCPKIFQRPIKAIKTKSKARFTKVSHF